MVFRTAGAVATALIGVGRHALAQYYPPPSGLSAPAASPYGKCRRVAAGQSARGAAGSATVGREWDQLISPQVAARVTTCGQELAHRGGAHSCRCARCRHQPTQVRAAAEGPSSTGTATAPSTGAPDTLGWRGWRFAQGVLIRRSSARRRGTSICRARRSGRIAMPCAVKRA
jgi:hypothetical protein